LFDAVILNIEESFAVLNEIVADSTGVFFISLMLPETVVSTVWP